VRLCDAAALAPGGSIRFPLSTTPGRFGPVQREGFAIRLPGGAVRAYVNVCPHRGQPVDLGDGRLFNTGAALECQAHGALFDAGTGACRSGPCFGQPLSPLEVAERDGAIWLIVHDDPVDDPT
jgi:nitrite reductase/ring-hydroxylating ferredoxin subunit